jgi:hypothetical protein
MMRTRRLPKKKMTTRTKRVKRLVDFIFSNTQTHPDFSIFLIAQDESENEPEPEEEPEEEEESEEDEEDDGEFHPNDGYATDLMGDDNDRELLNKMSGVEREEVRFFSECNCDS